MTPDELRAFKAKHNLRTAELAWILHVDRRAVERWIDGTRKPTPISCTMLAAFDQGLLDPAWIAAHNPAPLP